MTPFTEAVGLSGVAGVLPRRQYDLNMLTDAGLLVSAPEVLREFGFERVHVCDASTPVEDLVQEAAARALAEAGLQPHEVDLLVWASARPENLLARKCGTPDVMDGFRYASAWLQDAMELRNAEVLGVAQQGCTTMFSAIRVARSLLLSEPRREHALCVGVDVLPPGTPREILYNVISDAASAVVVSRGCSQDRWLGYTQLSRGYYWNPAACRAEIVASYFPTARAVIEQAMHDHGLGPDDIDVVVPTGVNRSSWDILLRLVGVAPDRLAVGRPSFGHSMTSDSFIYLEDIRRRREVPAGARLLLFTFGFGSSWCALLLEH